MERKPNIRSRLPRCILCNEGTRVDPPCLNKKYKYYSREAVYIVGFFKLIWGQRSICQYCVAGITIRLGKLLKNYKIDHALDPHPCGAEESWWHILHGLSHYENPHIEICCLEQQCSGFERQIA